MFITYILLHLLITPGQGGMPCLRCQRYKRNCQYSQAPPQPASNGTTRYGETIICQKVLCLNLHYHRASTSPQRDSDKGRCLERIVRHFMGDISFEPSNLQFIADALERDQVSSRKPSTLAPGSSELYSIHPLSTNTMSKLWWT